MTYEVFVLALVGIICGTVFLCLPVILLIQLIKRRKENRSLNDEESELLQELWDGIQKMDDRMTNLETIVLSQSQKPEYEKRY
jgi:phage shock protein B